jgi:peptidoglycan/xylan/chitin deacetylase (PgdA/CDA1 family)
MVMLHSTPVSLSSVQTAKWRLRIGTNMPRESYCSKSYPPTGDVSLPQHSKAIVRVPGFVYHDVRRDADPANALDVSAQAFERQVHRLFRAGYQGIAASDWVAHCLWSRPLPPKPVLLTLDDAYEGAALHALPVLREFGFSATVFVITRMVGRTWEGRRAMTAAQIREWSSSGIEFGAHSRTHPDLRTISGLRLHDEIVGSGDELAQILGSAPAAFAYPFGECTAEAVRLAGQTFGAAFSTEGGLNTPATNRHQLRRCIVFQNDSTAMIRWGAITGFNPIYEVRKAMGFRRCMRTFRSITGYSGSLI